VLEGDEAQRVLEILRDDSARCYEHYIEMLNEDEEGNVIEETRQGLTRELARMNLPLNIYTQWYWKCDLHNLLHFIGLRADPHAQYEIRAYAEVLLETVRRWAPLVCEAFEKYAVAGMTLSGPALAVVKRMIDGEAVEQEGSGLSKREWRELMASLGREE